MGTITEKQKFLTTCFKAYGLDLEDTVGIMHYLREEEKQDKTLEWMRSHISASRDEALDSALRIAGLK